MNRSCKPSGSRCERRSDADDLVVQSQSLIPLNVPSRHLICSHDDRFKVSKIAVWARLRLQHVRDDMLLVQCAHVRWHKQCSLPPTAFAAALCHAALPACLHTVLTGIPDLPQAFCEGDSSV